MGSTQEESNSDVEFDPLSFVEVNMSIDPEPVPPIPQVPSKTKDCAPVQRSTLKKPPVASLKKKTAKTKTAEELEKLKKCLEKCKKEASDLKEKVSQQNLVIGELENDDVQTQYYTGLNTWSLFNTVYDLCTNDSSNQQTTGELSFKQEFLITLMRLRLNLKIQDLGYRFHVPQSSISKCILKWIDLLFNRLPGSSFAFEELSNIEDAGIDTRIIIHRGKITVMDDARMKELRTRLKINYSILEADSYCEEDGMKDDEVDGIAFIDKVAIVCECLLNMNHNVN